MALSDTIADLLTRIRNAATAKHKYVDVRFSKMNLSIIEVLKGKGFIINHLSDEKRHAIRVFLKYERGSQAPILSGLKRMSKPGIRHYVKCHEIPRVLSGLGTAILSTPSGVIDGEKARELKVGGELLCLVW